MNMKTAYSYTILRYVHDVLTGEFLNVGVVVHMPGSAVVCFKMRSTMGRLKGVFPDIDRGAFVSSIFAVRRGLQKIAKDESSAGFFKSEGDAVAIARKAIPADDSSLQWSPPGTGIADDPQKALDRLFERFVSRYDSHSRHRRTDDEVWKTVRQKLEELNLGERLHEKTINGGLDDIIFKHAWRNGQWHVYEPLSFDLVDADGIKGKAREWLGHLSAVQAGGQAEQFKAHFVVGAPSNPALTAAYETAIAILKTAPNHPEVFEESQVESLVSRIEAEVRTHDAELNG